MPLVSVTRLRLRAPRYLLPFLRHAILSTRQAQQANGNLTTQTRRTKGNAFWTMTLWENEATMRRYMSSGAHRQAMPKLVEWCDEASTVHWWQETTKLPTWPEAEHQMVTQGRIHTVQHPSAAQSQGVIKV